MSLFFARRDLRHFRQVAIAPAVVLMAFAAGCRDLSSPLLEEESFSASKDEVLPTTEFEQVLADRIETLENDAKSDASRLQSDVALETDERLRSGGTHWIDGPTVIEHPGYYRVAHDFIVSEAQGDAIVVRSNFVWLDLGGKTITGPGNKVGRGVVVDDSRWVFVANGRVETFGIGIAILDTHRSAVASVHVEGGDEMAAPPTIPPQIGFLLVNSSRNTIRWNSVHETNLGFFVRGGGSYRNHFSHNEAVAGQHGLLAICYNPADGEGFAGPANDVVRRNLLSRFGTGIQTSAGSTHNLFAKNRIEYLNEAYHDFNGTNEFVDNTTIQILP